jgi:hypothetical protein
MLAISYCEPEGLRDMDGDRVHRMHCHTYEKAAAALGSQLG